MDDYNPNAGPNASNAGGAPQSPHDANATRYFPPVAAQPQGTQPATGYQVGESSIGVPTNQPGSQPHASIAPQFAYPAQQPQAQPRPASNERDRTILGLVLVAGGVLFLLDQLDIFGSLGNMILLVIGGVFMYAYFSTRQGHRIGFLIPGAILLGLGAGQAFESLPIPRLWSGDMTTFTLGLGFCLIWALERKHWWSLIPGGILVTVGLSSFFAIVQLWPLALIVLGAYLLYDQSRRRSP